MKKGFLLFAGAAILATTFVGCSKDDNDSLDLTNANIAGTYRMTGNKSVASTSAGGPSQTTDNYATFDACEKDDTYAFSATGTITETDAGTTCTSTPTPDTYAYSVNQTNKTITVDGETYNVDNLTSSQLIVSQTETYTQSGVTFTVKSTVTFTK